MDLPSHTTTTYTHNQAHAFPKLGLLCGTATLFNNGPSPLAPINAGFALNAGRKAALLHGALRCPAGVIPAFGQLQCGFVAPYTPGSGLAQVRASCWVPPALALNSHTQLPRHSLRMQGCACALRRPQPPAAWAPQLLASSPPHLTSPHPPLTDQPLLHALL